MNRLMMSVLGMAVGAVALGCDNSPPPGRVPVPAQGTLGPPQYDPARPLPGQYVPPQQYAPPVQQQQQYTPPSPQGYAPQPQQASPQQGYAQPSYVPPQPGYVQSPGFDPRIAAPSADQVYIPQPVMPQPGAYNDVAIVRDRPPEQRAFVDAYNRVGRPKIAIYMNRKLDGEMIPAGDANAAAVPTPLPAAGNQTYLKPGQYDEAWARDLDYEAVENILTDWLAAGGNTEVISPTMARTRMSQEQREALERGERFVLTDVTQRLDADIFVQVQARPTRQTARGLEFRLVAEALNTRGGRSIGRAVVDMPAPLEKTTINEYTRFLARKLMDDMIGAWNSPSALQQQQPAPGEVPPTQSAPPASVQPPASIAPPASMAPPPSVSVSPPVTIAPPVTQVPR